MFHECVDMGSLLPPSMQNRYQHFVEQFNKRRTVHEYYNLQEKNKKPYCHILPFSGAVSKNKILTSQNRRTLDSDTLHFPEIKPKKTALNSTVRLKDGNCDKFPRIPQPQTGRNVISCDINERRQNLKTRRHKTNCGHSKQKKVTQYSIGTSDFEQWLMYGDEEEKFLEDGGYSLLERIDKIYDNERKTFETLELLSPKTKCVEYPRDIRLKLCDKLHKKYIGRMKDGINYSYVNPPTFRTWNGDFCNHCIHKKRQQKYKIRNQDESVSTNVAQDDKTVSIKNQDERKQQPLRFRENKEIISGTNKSAQIYFYNGLLITPKEKLMHNSKPKNSSWSVDTKSTFSDIISPSSSNDTEHLQEQRVPHSNSKMTFTIVIPCCTQDADEDGHACCNGGVVSNQYTNSNEDFPFPEKDFKSHMNKKVSVHKDTEEGKIAHPLSKSVLALEKLQGGDSEVTTSERCSFWLAKQCPS